MLIVRVVLFAQLFYDNFLYNYKFTKKKIHRHKNRSNKERERKNIMNMREKIIIKIVKK